MARWILCLLLAEALTFASGIILLTLLLILTILCVIRAILDEWPRLREAKTDGFSATAEF
jgi:hypothetical protein